MSPRYTLLEPLGRGGFCTVYRARASAPDGSTREVAVKLLNPGHATSAEALRRLREEARVLSCLHHPAVVSAEGLVQIGESWALVMERVRGRQLSAVLAAAGTLPLTAALQVTAAVSGALAAGWSADRGDGQPLRLLHRDVKPDNILLTQAGGVRLIDFGIARAARPEHSGAPTEALLGTPAYTAPERYDGIEHPAGDIYSLGCVLFEMVTGEPLGRTSANPERHEEVWASALERAATTPGVSGEVLALLSDMLDGEPDARPSAEEVALRCDALLHPAGSLWAFARSNLEPIDLSPVTVATTSSGEPAEAPTPAPAPAPAPTRRPLWWVAAASVGGLLLLAASAGAPTADHEPPAGPVENPRETRVTDESLPAPGVESGAEEVPESELELEPEPEPAPAPIPELARVTAAEGAAVVTLRAEGSGREHAVPGAVPPGRYQVWGDGTPCGMLTLAGGQRVVLLVDPLFSRYEVR